MILELLFFVGFVFLPKSCGLISIVFMVGFTSLWGFDPKKKKKNKNYEYLVNLLYGCKRRMES